MITRNPTEQEHQHAVDDSEEREEKIHEAIEKIVTTIEELTEQSSDSLPDSEFETTLPMGPEADEEWQTAELPTSVTYRPGLTLFREAENAVHKREALARILAAQESFVAC